MIIKSINVLSLTGINEALSCYMDESLTCCKASKSHLQNMLIWGFYSVPHIYSASSAC